MAEDLSLNDLKAIKTIADLANYLGTTPKRLSHLLYSERKPQYHEFTIPKSSGAPRQITAPPSPIKALQKALYPALLDAYRRKTPVHGFVKGYGILSNAKRHENQTLLLNLDLEDFFPTIHFGRVRGVFMKAPFNLEGNVASVLATLCCHDKKLPQGAPTSPIISNFICRTLDRSLLEIAHKHGCRYTRYADDITFSTTRNEFPRTLVEDFSNNSNISLGHALLTAIDKAGFNINQRKVRLANKKQRQEVTGLIVNKHANIPRKFVRNLRATLFKIEKDGYDATNSEFQARDNKTRTNGSPSLRSHIRGKLDYISMVRGNGDALLSRMFLRASKAIPEFNHRTILTKDAALTPKLVEHAVFSVVAHNPEGEHFRGTAFALCDFGLVTNDHVIEASADLGAISKWELVNAADPTLRLTVTGVRSRSHSDSSLPIWLDLAILDVDDAPPAELLTGNSPQEGIDVVLAGFPAAGSAGEAMSLTPGLTTRRKARNGITYLLTTVGIVKGNSGGPLIDRQTGLVVGAGTYDSSNPEFPNGAVAIEHLKDVQSLAVTPVPHPAAKFT